MALVKGICKNFGECDLADNKEIQEVDKTNFVCEECGKPLYSLDNPNTTKTGGLGGRKSLICGVIAGVIVLLGGAGFGIWSYLSDIKPEKVILDQEVLELQVGQRAQLLPSVEPSDAEVIYTWKSENEAVATVTDSGMVQALQKGETTIVLSVAENKSLEAYCKVIVTEKDSVLPPPTIDTVYVEKISTSDSIITLKVGEKKALSYTTIPEKHDEEIIPTISDDAIITLSQTGEVVALKAGNATITFSSDKSGKQAKVEVTVKSNNEEGGDTPGKVNLSFGIYEGPRKNFKADGFGGTITVTRSYSIDLKKASGETVMVNRGDKIVSVKMENGRLRQGEIHFADGTRKYISGL